MDWWFLKWKMDLDNELNFVLEWKVYEPWTWMNGPQSKSNKCNDRDDHPIKELDQENESLMVEQMILMNPQP